MNVWTSRTSCFARVLLLRVLRHLRVVRLLRVLRLPHRPRRERRLYRRADEQSSTDCICCIKSKVLRRLCRTKCCIVSPLICPTFRSSSYVSCIEYEYMKHHFKTFQLSVPGSTDDSSQAIVIANAFASSFWSKSVHSSRAQWSYSANLHHLRQN